MAGNARWWRYVDGDAPGDGRAWLANPSELFGFIDFRGAATGPTFRIMVATRAFVDQALEGLKGGRARIVFAAMLVVPDGTAQEIDTSIAAAVNGGGLEHFATELSDAPSADRSSSRPAV